MTNKEFARRIGCDFTTASSYRNGRRRPRLATLIKIGREFGIPFDDLAEAWVAGAPAWGKFMRERVFEGKQLELIPSTSGGTE